MKSWQGTPDTHACNHFLPLTHCSARASQQGVDEAEFSGPALRARDERVAYYNKHDIAYVARPPHGKDGFVRGGRFKKASNMNVCLAVSQQVSKFMQVRASTAIASSALSMHLLREALLVSLQVATPSFGVICEAVFTTV